MRIAHISDLHVSAMPVASPGPVRGDTVARLRALIADLVELDPDLVAIIGGLTHDGGPDDHALLRELLALLRMPVLLLSGNHDNGTELRRALPQADWCDPDFRHRAYRTRGVRFLALDTLAVGGVAGWLCPARGDWLRGRLAEPFEGPALVAMHHPTCPAGLGLLDRNTLIERGVEPAAMVAAMARPPIILSGHMHLPFQSLWSGAPACGVASPAFDYDLPTTPDAEPPLTERAFGYASHLPGPGGQHVSHQQYPTP